MESGKGLVPESDRQDGGVFCFFICFRSWLRGYKKNREFFAHVAQMVERILGKDEVSGSIPLVGSSVKFVENIGKKEIRRK